MGDRRWIGAARTPSFVTTGAEGTRQRGAGLGTARAADLKGRTLTNLSNARRAWLAALHVALDRAVWAAYGWADDPSDTSDEAILKRLLALNGERV